MNYLRQLNAFNELKLTNPVSANAQSLYMNLLHVNNRCHWTEEFSVSNSYMMILTGLSRVGLDRARNELKQKGYINYTKRSGNQAGMYLIVRYDTQIDTQMYTQSDTQPDTQLLHKCIHTFNNNKRKQNKTKNNNNINNNIILNTRSYSDESLNTYYAN